MAEKRGARLWLRIAVSVLFAAVLVGSAWLAFDRIYVQTDDAQISLVKEAVRKTLLTCYAVEGYYPADVGVLERDYGLKYNQERFAVVLDGFAANIMPTISVIRKGADGP